MLKKIDKPFLIIITLLVLLGIVIFISASFGILAKNKNIFYSLIFNQLIFGLGLGLLGIFISLKLNYKFWKDYAFLIFLASILLTAAVFIPSLGVSYNGARRWIEFGFFSFQPVEILKFGFIIYFAGFLSWAKNRQKNLAFNILPFIAMISIIAFLLLKQPDTKSFILISATGIIMLFLSDVSIKKIMAIFLLIFISLAVLVNFTPYLQKRIKTFLDPTKDSLGSSYQVQQSFIAIGSGNIFGRGYGQSVQKFGYLPEPHGDSIFSIFAEEFGLVGSTFLIILYLLFLLRGLQIANRSTDSFARLLVSGIVLMITMQSFMHIASNIGIFPYTGVPLVFISHGGTSLMMSLAAIGIVLEISKQTHIS